MSTTIEAGLRWAGWATIALTSWSLVMLALPFVGTGRTLAVVGDTPALQARLAAADARIVEVRDGAILVRGKPGLARRLYGAGAPLERLGHGDDHAPVLERAGRVGALDLEVQVGTPDGPAEVASVDERREPLPQRQPGRVRGHGQERGVPMHQPRPWPVPSLLLAQPLEHLAHAHPAHASARTG